jgi:hypothetical protein
MNKWTRQIHRWTSMLFMATVVLNIVVMSMNPGQQPPPLVVYSPLLPLFVLMLTGIYLFVLPYAVRWRARG